MQTKLWLKEMPYYDDKVEFIPEITAYPARSKGCIIVCPGGGYGMRASHEGAAIAEWLNSVGITAFVLDYRVEPYKHPAAISDAMRAVKYVRYNADKFGIDKDKIAIMGFSAGGHLAGSLSVHYDKNLYEPIDEVDYIEAKPNATILCYPVIDMLEYRHDGSRQNLLGENPAHEMKEFMSLYKHVTKETPPAFLWHTAADAAVPVENSLMYASALSKVQVPFEMHIYPQGNHGLGLAPENSHVAQWTDALEKWLEFIDFK